MKNIKENYLIENEQYSCTECPSNIEINSIDEINNIISFSCPSHGNKSITIKDYLKDMKKNTFYYNKCNSCGKQQNKINNNEIFNFCLNCKIILCNKCIVNHDKNHLSIKNNKIKTKCILHPKNNNLIYCLDCNCHLCKECFRQEYEDLSCKRLYSQCR